MLEHTAFYDFKLNGIIVYSRARWVENGGKKIFFFSSLEKRDKISNTVDAKISNTVNELSTEESHILKTSMIFY